MKLFRFNFLILFIYCLILIILISNYKLSIAETAFLRGSDDLTFYERSLTTAVNFDFYSKNFIIGSLLFTSIKMQEIFSILDMHIYSFLKGIIQYFCTLFFIFSISKIYSKRIAYLTFIILLFDPYLFSLKFTLLRDDLICSFGLLSIAASLEIKNIIFKKLISINYIFFVIGLLGLFGTKPILGSIIFLLSIIYWVLDLNFLEILKNFRIKIKWLLIPLSLIAIVLSISDGYFKQVFLLFTPSIKNIFITFQKHFLSPLPWKPYLSKAGLDISDVYWWMEIRFFIVLFFSLLVIIAMFKRPLLFFKYFSFIGISGIIIFLSYSQVQDLVDLWGYSAGPRQGYLSYFLLVAPSIFVFFKVFKLKIK